MDFLPDPVEYWNGNGKGQAARPPVAPATHDGRYLLKRPRCPLCGGVVGKGCNVKYTKRNKKGGKTFPRIYCQVHKKYVECDYV